MFFFGETCYVQKIYIYMITKNTFGEKYEIIMLLKKSKYMKMFSYVKTLCFFIVM